MLKRILYSSFNKRVYDKIKGIPLVSLALKPLANFASLNYLENTKSKLDVIGPSFCTAKWLQSTLHLEIGETHSCHHPKRHKIDVDEVKKNPNRLHNTAVKEEARREMLKGKYPSECEYCWRVERNGDYSDRIYKSSQNWANVDLKKLTTEDAIKNINPTYLEVSFSSDCNLKCAYCYPEVSSAIRAEILKWGPYPTSDHFGNLSGYQKTNEDLSEHFWKWWNSGLRNDLQVLRVTGGEPLLSKDFFKLLDEIENSSERFSFDLAVNSNLMVGKESVQRFCEQVEKIKSEKKIRSFHLYTSIDTWGPHAEFLRYGLDIKRFVENVETCLTQISSLSLTFMVTYNALSPFKFDQLLEFILDLRKRFPKSEIRIGTSILHNPAFLSAEKFKSMILPYVQNNLDFMRANILSAKKTNGFSNFEIQHLERIYHHIQASNESFHEHDLKNFKLFIEEYEKRKKLNFLETFEGVPEFQKILS